MLSNFNGKNISERFGDGDASQIGLDLDEVLSFYFCFPQRHMHGADC